MQVVCAVEAAAEAEAAGALLVVKVAGVLGVLERWALRVTGWQDSEEALDHDAVRLDGREQVLLVGDALIEPDADLFGGAELQVA